MHVRNERIELQLDVKLMTIGMLAYIQELDIVKEDEVMVREGYETYEKQKVDLEVAKRKVIVASQDPVFQWTYSSEPKINMTF